MRPRSTPSRSAIAKGPGVGGTSVCVTAPPHAIAVTAENVNDTVVADEFYSVDDICTDEYADACAEAGLS